MKYRIILPSLLLLAALLALPGCGQKGDLYLPDHDEQGERPRR